MHKLNEIIQLFLKEAGNFKITLEDIQILPYFEIVFRLQNRFNPEIIFYMEAKIRRQSLDIKIRNKGGIYL